MAEVDITVFARLSDANNQTQRFAVKTVLEMHFTVKRALFNDIMITHFTSYRYLPIFQIVPMLLLSVSNNVGMEE